MKARWTSFAALAAAAASLLAAASEAQEHRSYASLSGGAVFPQDSDDSGSLATAFTAPSGAVFPPGSPASWTTTLDDGYTAAGAIGASTSSGWRGELELAFASTGVGGHSGACLLDVCIASGGDAGDIFGPAAAGQTVETALASDSGTIESTFLMFNAFRDFGGGRARLSPYVGGGLGMAWVDVDYRPLGTVLADDEDTVFAWQAIAGASYALSDRVDVFGQGRYRATQDVETRGPELGIPLALEIGNESFVLELGMRSRF